MRPRARLRVGRGGMGMSLDRDAGVRPVGRGLGVQVSRSGCLGMRRGGIVDRPRPQHKVNTGEHLLNNNSLHIILFMRLITLLPSILRRTFRPQFDSHMQCSPNSIFRISNVV